MTTMLQESPLRCCRRHPVGVWEDAVGVATVGGLRVPICLDCWNAWTEHGKVVGREHELIIHQINAAIAGGNVDLVAELDASGNVIEDRLRAVASAWIAAGLPMTDREREIAELDARLAYLSKINEECAAPFDGDEGQVRR